MLQKRGSGQILECLRKRLEPWTSAGSWASHPRPGRDGAAAAPEEEDEGRRVAAPDLSLGGENFPPNAILQSPGQGTFVLGV